MRDNVRPILRTVLVAALLVLPGAAVAQLREPSAGAVTRNVHHPIVITRPGVYTVGSEIEVGAGRIAVLVRSDDVLLDLGGHTLSGPGGPGSVGVEVRGVANVRVRNGALTGFGVGVLITDATNVRVEGLQIDGTDAGGAPPDVEIGIIIVDSRGVVVEDNLVTRVFLGVFVRGGISGGNRIAGNTITGGEHGELGICYNPAPTGGSAGPTGDLVYGNFVSRFQRGIALSAESRDNVVRENTLATFGAAIEESSAGSNLIADNAVTTLAP